MKTLLFLILILTFSETKAAQAGRFTSVKKCQTYIKGEEPLVIDVQEAKNDDAKLIIKYPLRQEPSFTVLAKKILPPDIRTGVRLLKYIGTNVVTKEKVMLAIGTKPFSVGSLNGNGGTLSLERQEVIQLICTENKF